jgi:hypothetical protein
MLTTPDHADAVTSPAAPAPVGPNPKGFYQDCDPPTGRAGTVYRAEDFNELILNLRALLDAAALVGTKGDATMLRTTLHRLYAGGGRVVAATGALTPSDAGLILVDATTAPINLTLPAAAALPGGRQTFQIVRVDVTANDVRILPAAGDALRGGVLYVDAANSAIVRSDGVTTWYPLAGTAIVQKARTLNVSPTGVAAPTDPFGGTPFDTLQRALTWLASWRINGTVGIAIAAGTYVSTQTVTIAHPDAARVTVAGATTATTILRFNGAAGIVIPNGLAALKTLTVQGDGAGGSLMRGVDVMFGMVASVQDVTVTGFAGAGFNIRGGAMVNAQGVLTTSNNLQEGLRIENGGTLGAGTIEADNNAGTANVTVSSGTLAANGLNTVNGQRGLSASGAGCYVQLNGMSIKNSSVPSQAVIVGMGAVLTGSGTANAWIAWDGGATGHTYRAENYGFIWSGASLQAATRAVTSPAVNTLGNIQAYVQSN